MIARPEWLKHFGSKNVVINAMKAQMNKYNTFTSASTGCQTDKITAYHLHICTPFLVIKNKDILDGRWPGCQHLTKPNHGGLVRVHKLLGRRLEPLHYYSVFTAVLSSVTVWLDMLSDPKCMISLSPD